MNDDMEVWLLFAPFWLLGMVALAGAIWHMIHLVVVTRRAQAAGHVRKVPAFSRGLKFHELTDEGKHHYRRSLWAVGLLVGITALAILVGFLWAMGRR